MSETSFFRLSRDAVALFKTASTTVDPYIPGGAGPQDGGIGLDAGAGADFNHVFGDPEDVSLFPVTLGPRFRL